MNIIVLTVMDKWTTYY